MEDLDLVFAGEFGGCEVTRGLLPGNLRQAGWLCSLSSSTAAPSLLRSVSGHDRPTSYHAFPEMPSSIAHGRKTPLCLR